MKCKAIQCKRAAQESHDFCFSCAVNGPYTPMTTQDFYPPAIPIPGKSLAEQYPQYYKPVGSLTEVDVYAVHHMFNIQDPSGCTQHASKKLLLSGVRTGGKSAYDDIREARDTLNRWLQLNPDVKQPA